MRGQREHVLPLFPFSNSPLIIYLPSARLQNIHIGGSSEQNTDNRPSGDFGLIGLAVMGQNLILNAADHGYNVIAFNRTVSKVDHFLANEAKGTFLFSLNLELFCSNSDPSTRESIYQQSLLSA